MACNANFQNCVNRERQNMRYPMDARSLYANRIYDNQTANSRCYSENPIDIVEGFGMGSLSLVNILKWVIVALIIFAIYLCVRDYAREEISLNVNSVGTDANSTLAVTKP